MFELISPSWNADHRRPEPASPKIFAKTLGLVACLMGSLLVGCATEDTTQTEDELGQSCQPKCEKCRKGELCSQVCYIPDHCQSTCTQFEMCLIGYQWDDKSCQCVSSQPSGEACGPSLVCHGSDHCCTAGPISTDPTQNDYFCAAATEICPL